MIAATYEGRIYWICNRSIWYLSYTYGLLKETSRKHFSIFHWNNICIAFTRKYTPSIFFTSGSLPLFIHSWNSFNVYIYDDVCTTVFLMASVHSDSKMYRAPAGPKIHAVVHFVKQIYTLRLDLKISFSSFYIIQEVAHTVTSFFFMFGDFHNSFRYSIKFFTAIW